MEQNLIIKYVWPAEWPNNNKIDVCLVCPLCMVALHGISVSTPLSVVQTADHGNYCVARLGLISIQPIFTPLTLFAQLD